MKISAKTLSTSQSHQLDHFEFDVNGKWKHEEIMGGGWV